MNIGDLHCNFSTNVATLISDFGRAVNAVDKMESRFKKMGQTIDGALAGLGAGALFKKMFDEAAQGEQAMRKVEAVLRSTGGAAGVTAKQVQDLAQELQKLTGVDADAITEAEALLLTFTKIGKDVFPEATKAALDMSATFGMDLKQAAIQVGKALQDPTAQMAALKKEGINFTDTQKQLIKYFQDTNQLAEAQKIILRELATETGGTAAALRDSLGGAMKALQQSVDDLFQALGDGPNSGLRSGLEGTVKVVDMLTEGVPKLGDAFNELGRMMAPMGEAILNALSGPANVFIGFVKSANDYVGLLAQTIDMFQKGTIFDPGQRDAVRDNFIDSLKQNFSTDYFDTIRQEYKNFWQEIDNETRARSAQRKKAAGPKGAGGEEQQKPGVMTPEEYAKETAKWSKLGEKFMSDQFQDFMKDTGTIEKENLETVRMMGDELADNLGKREDERNSLADIFKEMENQFDKTKAQMGNQDEILAALEAQEKVSKLTTLSTEERADAVKKLTELILRQKEIEAQTKAAESLDKYGLDIEKLRRKTQGLDEYNKELELTRELTKNVNDEDAKRLISDKVKELAAEERRLNSVLEDQKNVLDFISKSSAGYRDKLGMLQQALDEGRITWDQYTESMKKVNEAAAEKGMKLAAEWSEKLSDRFSEIITKGKSFKDVIKDLGKELAALAAKKLLFEPLANMIVGGANKLFGGGAPGGALGAGLGGGLASGLMGMFGGKSPALPAAPGSSSSPRNSMYDIGQWAKKKGINDPELDSVEGLYDTNPAEAARIHKKYSDMMDQDQGKGAAGLAGLFGGQGGNLLPKLLGNGFGQQPPGATPGSVPQLLKTILDQSKYDIRQMRSAMDIDCDEIRLEVRQQGGKIVEAIERVFGGKQGDIAGSPNKDGGGFDFNRLIQQTAQGPAWRAYVANCPCPDGQMAKAPIPGLPEGGGYGTPSGGGSGGGGGLPRPPQRTTSSTTESWSGNMNMGGLFDAMLGGGLAGIGMLGGLFGLGGEAQAMPQPKMQTSMSSNFSPWAAKARQAPQSNWITDRQQAQQMMMAERDRQVAALYNNSNSMDPRTLAQRATYITGDYNQRMATANQSQWWEGYSPGLAPASSVSNAYSSGWGSMSNGLALAGMNAAGGVMDMFDTPKAAHIPGVSGAGGNYGGIGYATPKHIPQTNVLGPWAGMNANPATAYINGISAPIQQSNYGKPTYWQATPFTNLYQPETGNPLMTGYGGGIARPRGFADGGEFEAGTFMEVGERGRELIAPSFDGKVIPHKELLNGGGRAPTVQIVNNSSVPVASSSIEVSDGGRNVKAVLEDQLAGSMRVSSRVKQSLARAGNFRPKGVARA